MDIFSEFTLKFKNSKDFYQQQDAEQCFVRLTSDYLSSSWLIGASDSDRMIVFKCLRLLLRDECFLERVATDTSALVSLSKTLQSITHKYLKSHQEDIKSTNLVIELCNIFQKLTHCELTHSLLLDYDIPNQLFFLISTSDHHIIQLSLNSLINLSKTLPGRQAVLDCYPMGTILNILSSHDFIIQSSACDLFLLLSQEDSAQNQMKEEDLLQSCLVLIQSDICSLYVKRRILESLGRLLVDHELTEDFRKLGGIQVILILLNPKWNSFEDVEYSHMLTALFTLLMRLSLNDVCAKQIVENNGLFLIADYIVTSLDFESTNEVKTVQLHCMRTLRYLFSLERNRRSFKKLFPAYLFEDFINIGYYIHDLSSYANLVDSLQSLSSEHRQQLIINHNSLNQTKAPLYTIAEYSVLELLGTGAYGNVYKVRKGSQSALYALKELQPDNLMLDANSHRDSIGELKSEVAMINEKLHHPNIVRYYKCFEEHRKVYIEMSLIDGAPLNEFIASMKEKGDCFSEDRILNIFSQLIRALRYLHEDKKIVHRDLKPANMILGEQDKLTITDFGLAKHYKDLSLMKSTVGTMIYWCPELVENKEYDKKADIWAAGCILYEMCTLQPPFYATNMLLLAKKIAEVQFDKSLVGGYSNLLQSVICSCLTVNPSARPDSHQIGSMLAEHLMKQLDDTLNDCALLENKITTERNRALKQFEKKERNTSAKRMLFTGSPPASPHNQKLSPSRRSSLGSPLLLSISSQHLKEISDPVSDILQAVHKIVYITQLPCFHKDSRSAAACYSIVSRYKRIIFGDNFQTKELKAEMRKLTSRSSEEVDVLPPLPHLLPAALTELSDEYPKADGNTAGMLTYDHLHIFIEQVLKDTNYYE